MPFLLILFIENTSSVRYVTSMFFGNVMWLLCSALHVYVHITLARRHTHSEKIIWWVAFLHILFIEMMRIAESERKQCFSVFMTCSCIHHMYYLCPARRVHSMIMICLPHGFIYSCRNEMKWNVPGIAYPFIYIYPSVLMLTCHSGCLLHVHWWTAFHILLVLVYIRMGYIYNAITQPTQQRYAGWFIMALVCGVFSSSRRREGSPHRASHIHHRYFREARR